MTIEEYAAAMISASRTAPLPKLAPETVDALPGYMDVRGIWATVRLEGDPIVHDDSNGQPYAVYVHSLPGENPGLCKLAWR